MAINIEKLLSPGRTTHAELAKETHCHWCEELFNDEQVFQSNPTTDHLIPLNDLGPKRAAFNLVRACQFCNGLRGHTNLYEWDVVVHDFVKPHRRDLPGMAQALAQGDGFRRYAAIVKTLAERQALERIDEVAIRRWAVDDAASEFNVSLKRLPKDYGVDWLGLITRIVTLVEVKQVHGPVWTSAGLDLQICRDARHGARIGTEIAMVNALEWRILKTFKDSPEAMKFREIVGDGNVNMNLLKLGRDRIGVLLHRSNRTRHDRKNVILYGTSGAAALRIHDYVTTRLLPHLENLQKEVDTQNTPLT